MDSYDEPFEADVFYFSTRRRPESSRVTEAARVSFVFNFLISPPCSVFSVTTSVQRVTRQPRWSMRFPNRSATTSPWRRSARSSRRRTARSASWNTVRREERGSSRLTNGVGSCVGVAQCEWWSTNTKCFGLKLSSFITYHKEGVTLTKQSIVRNFIPNSEVFVHLGKNIRPVWTWCTLYKQKTGH